MAKKLIAVRVDDELLEAMRRVKLRDGVPFSVQIDFALRRWLSDRDTRLSKTGSQRQRNRRGGDE